MMHNPARETAREISAWMATSLTQGEALPRTHLAQGVRLDLKDGFLAEDFGNFGSLLALAEEKINTLPFQDVDAGWLRLYVDATIGLALQHLAMDNESRRVGGAKEMIRKLDMSIIVAGGIGPGRADILQRLIDLCQADLAATPSLSEYLSTHLAQPFIIRNHLAEDLAWSAVEKWSDSAYVLDATGPGRVVPVEVGKSYTDAGWGQQIIPLEDFMRRIGYAEMERYADSRSDGISSGFDRGIQPDQASKQHPPLYLAQHPLFTQFPKLERDISMPDFVYSCPPAPENMTSYRPPGNDDALIVNVWIGSGGGKITSPAHTDPYYNCYAQVLGRKRVWLAPPSVTPHMYAFDHEHEQGDDAGTGHLPAGAVEAEHGLASSYASNTSSVPIFAAFEDQRSARRKFPGFYANARPESMEAVLESGDMLVMPPGWWHAMRGEGEGVAWSVSMWY